MRAERWLLSYALLGLTQSGVIPILMPLVSSSRAAAGVTYAAFSILGLCAPILGSWADRTGRHRDLLIWGSVGAGVLLLLFEAVGGPLRIAIAAGAGLGTTAAATAGNVLAIQGKPEADWDTNVARLQRFMSAGQVLGLIGAGLLAHSHPRGGFILAAIALLAAGVLGFLWAPARSSRDRLDKPESGPMVGGDAAAPAAHHRGHRANWRELVAFLTVINQRLRRFLIVWLIAYPAMNGFATIFPVAMTREFGMDPILPSAAYALGVGFSLLLYSPIATVTHRIGGGRMLMMGLAARLVLLAALTPLALWRDGWTAWVILVGFALVQLVWPLLSVASNSLSVRLAPGARGESVGLFNAATSLAAAGGSALAGVIFGAYGLSGLAGAAGVAVAVGLVLTVLWVPRAPAAS
jgi:MFS family permease